MVMAEIGKGDSMIRPITLNDVVEVVKISRVFYDEMDFDRYGYHFDDQTIKDGYISAALNPEKFICFVSEEDGINGVIFCTVQDRTLYFTGRKFAQEIVWHSSPDLPMFQRSKAMLALLKAAEQRMKELGGMPFYLSSDLRPEFAGVGRYLAKHGYTKITEYFFKGV